MSLFIVRLNNEEETLLFIRAKTQDEVRVILLEQGIVTFTIHGIVAHTDSDESTVNHFYVDQVKLEEFGLNTKLYQLLLGKETNLSETILIAANNEDDMHELALHYNPMKDYTWEELSAYYESKGIIYKTQ